MKDDFRKECLKKLSNFSFNSSLSFQLQVNLNSLLNQLSVNYNESNPLIFSYIAKGYEFSTDHLLQTFFKTSNICVPRCIDQENMEAVKISSFDDLETGRYGIKEPKKDKMPLSNEVIDIAIVPGVSFDKQFNRLGRGKGYYDRFLSTLVPMPVKIGVCWDIQLFDFVPHEENDQKMDFIVTPSMILDYSKKDSAGYCFKEGGC